MIQTLPRVVPASPGKPVRAEAQAMQRASANLARDPSVWSARAAQEVVRRYQELAPHWDDERGGYRPLPLADALARGDVPHGGRCVEVGCGTGLLTPLLTGVWSQIVCLDLTGEMVRRSPAPWRLVADASRLPLPSGWADAVVLADVPLFADEVVRVLAPGGVVVWSNALGAEAPHHVPVDLVRSVLERADGGASWSAVTSDAGWGLWAVLRRG